MYHKILQAIRLHDWWHFILPPIFAFYLSGIQLSHSKAGFVMILQGLIELTALAIPVAAFGFFLNEWTDIEEDLAAGKRNYVVEISLWLRILIFLSITISLVAAIILATYPLTVLVLVVTQLGALVAYSVPPWRLKRYPIAAVLLDATYSGPLFFMIALVLSMGIAEWKFLMMAVLFGFIKGLRNIIFHLEQDKNFDLQAGKRTFAQMITTENAQKTQEVLWMLEAIILLYFGYFTTSLTFTLLLLGFVIILIKRNFYKSVEGRQQWLGELNTLYEIWFLVASACGVFYPMGWQAFTISLLALFFFFPFSRKIFHELYIAAYNGYYFISDLYFVYTKPHFDIGKFFRKLFCRK